MSTRQTIPEKYRILSIKSVFLYLVLKKTTTFEFYFVYNRNLQITAKGGQNKK